VTDISSPIPKNYIPQLDGIRGLAILLVITFHYFGNFSFFSFGWSGVDLFFVLSGYLITSRLVAMEKQENYLLQFYKNRALRIMPIYYATFFAFFIGYHLLVSKQNLSGFSFYDKNWASFVFFFQNWSFIEWGDLKENHLQHFWSLAIEEQFYLVWPFILYKFRKKEYFFKAIAFIIIIIIITRMWLFMKYSDYLDYPHFYYNTFCRMDAFLLGGLLFLFQQKGRAKQLINYYYAGTIILITGIIYSGHASISNPFISTIGYTLIALMYSGLIYSATTHSGKFVTRTFNFTWLKFIGKISYGLYIFHWIVLRVLEPRLSFWTSEYLGITRESSHWWSLFGCLLISFTLSVISFLYFESYFLRMKTR
jgi:peptidoglycan/LPS O-acetylase OafA/YrhL